MGDGGSMKDMANKLFPYAKERLGFDKPVQILYVDDDVENSSDIFGKTAYYSPLEQIITLFTHGRHPKDVLRSLSHELVHHAQYCRGDLDLNAETNEGYAQQDNQLRELEREAYEQGNLIFRDFEDMMKKKRKSLNESKIKVRIRK